MMSDKATMWTAIGVSAALMAGGGILQHFLPGGADHPLIQVMLFGGAFALLVAIASGRHVVRAAHDERPEVARKRDLRHT